MPTILRIDGFRIYFFSHEPGEPPHVHIDRGGATAKIWVESGMIASSAGFAARDLGDMLKLVRGHRRELLEAWRGFFDPGGNG